MPKGKKNAQRKSTKDRRVMVRCTTEEFNKASKISDKYGLSLSGAFRLALTRVK